MLFSCNNTAIKQSNLNCNTICLSQSLALKVAVSQTDHVVWSVLTNPLVILSSLTITRETALAAYMAVFTQYLNGDTFDLHPQIHVEMGAWSHSKACIWVTVSYRLPHRPIVCFLTIRSRQFVTYITCILHTHANNNTARTLYKVLCCKNCLQHSIQCYMLTESQDPHGAETKDL